jgi:hypothetical protein
MNNEQLAIFIGVSAEPGLLELCRATTENAAKLNEQLAMNNVQLAINNEQFTIEGTISVL